MIRIRILCVFFRLPTFVTLTLFCSLASSSPGQENRSRSFHERLDEIRSLQEYGQDRRSEELARGLLSDVEKQVGAHSWEAAEVLDLLVQALYRNGKRRRPETLNLAERAVELRRELAGKDSLELAASLHQLGQLEHSSSDFAGARALFEQGLEIRRRILGDDHPLVANSLQSLGLVIEEMGDVGKGRELLERSLAIHEKHLDPVHLETASVINDLAGLVYRQGDFPGAHSLYLRSLDLYQQLLDPRHPLIAKAIHNVGTLHHVRGDISEAFSFYEKALEIRQKIHGLDHPVTASTHTAIAMLFRETGDFTAARQHFEEALRGIGSGLGMDHPRYAVALSELGLLLEESGEYEEAERLQWRALEIRRAAFGERHPDFGQSLARVGTLALRRGRLEDAEIYLHGALDVLKLAFDNRNPRLVPALLGLAELAEQTGDLDQARALLERSIQITEGGRRDHPWLAEPLARLARLATSPKQAMVWNTRALEVLEAASGDTHPLAISLLEHRAYMKVVDGDSHGAFTDALRAAALSREHARQTILAMAERRALDFVGRHAAPLDLALALSSKVHSSPGVVEAVADAVIRARALVLDAVVARNQALHAAGDPATAAVAEQLANERRRLANLWVRARSDLAPVLQAELIGAARSQVERLEQRLAALSEPLLQSRERRQIGLDQVRTALPREAALVMCVRFSSSLADDPGPTYIALILPAGATPLAIVVLGSAEHIDRLVERWRKTLYEVADESLEKSLRANEIALQAVGLDLRRAVWDPIARHLGGARQVFLVPDGTLHLMQLAALPAPSGRYLIEDGPRIHLLTAERDLVELAKPSRRGRGLLAVGAPDFNDRNRLTTLSSEERQPPQRNTLWTSVLTMLGRGWTKCGSFDKKYFLPLPESGREIKEIAASVNFASMRSAGPPPPVALLSGADASEERVKQVAPGHRILHFATHGFFIGGHCSETPVDGREPDSWSPTSNFPTLALSHAGLVLAGANYRRTAQGHEEDGILTGEEIADLDLRGVELVVLSACETGLGDVLSGEGVLGLRRAFTIAGASTVVMSLWAVQDQSTRFWMREFYAARFRANKSIAEATEHAALAVLNSERAAGRSGHPFFWGGFVASGNWR